MDAADFANEVVINWPLIIDIIIAVFLATAVGVSLFIGLKSIRSTASLQQRQFRHAEKIQQREHSNRLITEIRDWALEVVISNFGRELSVKPGVSQTVQKQEMAANRFLRCQALSVKGKEYIKPIAVSLGEELGEENFSNDIESIVGVLEAIMGKIRERGHDIDNPEINKQLEELDSTLGILTAAVIKQTAEYVSEKLE